jgi:tetratricopeptide (TPR) repeat protein
MGRRKRSNNARMPVDAGDESTNQGDSSPGTMSGPTSSSTRAAIIVAVLVCTFIPFVTALYNDFAYDDRTQILQNEFIRSLSNIPRALVTEAWFWRQQQDKDPNKEDKATTPYYRPVFTIYLMFGWSIFQDSAGLWHFANILMHLIAVFLVFAVVERMMGDVWLAGISALIFGIHPLRAETVAWISGLTDLILAIFLLSSFYLYVVFREKNQKKFLLGSLGLYLIAIFSKEPAATYPLLIAAYEFFFANQGFPVKGKIKSALVSAAPFLLITGFYFAMRRYSLGFWLNDVHYRHYSLYEVLLTEPMVICKYLGLFVWPVNLSIYHETDLVHTPLNARFILPVMALAGVVFALRPAWKLKAGKFAILWFAINLLPVLNLSAFDVFFIMQERYLYLPSIGLSLLLAMALMRLPFEKILPVAKRRTAQIATLVLVCILLGGKTLAQNTVWKDDLTLFEHGAETADDQMMPHYILGHQYIKYQRYDKVVEELEKCVELSPENKVAMVNLASAHLFVYELTNNRSHIDRAIALCQQGLALDYKQGSALDSGQAQDQQTLFWDILGHAYLYETDLRNYDRALFYFGQGLRLEPNNPLILSHIGAAYLKVGNFPFAIQRLEESRRIDPEIPDNYKFLSYAYDRTGRTKEAVDSLTRYLALNPNAIDAAQQKQRLDQLEAKPQVGITN